MASATVRAALAAVIQKTPAKTSRSCKLREWAQELIDKSSQGDIHLEAFDKFSLEIIKCFKDMILSVADKYKLHTSKREFLWKEFHLATITGKPLELWKQLISKLEMSIDDCLLEQSLYQEVFEMSLKEHFVAVCQKTVASVGEVRLSADELNVLRYVSGYVAHQLLKRYERKSTDVYEQYVTCLGEMAVAGEGGDLLSYTTIWMEKVNRGGLFPVNDNTFHLFIEIEKCVRQYLLQHLAKPSSDRDSYLRNVHQKIVDNEDVQFHWTLLSQDVDNPNHSISLLEEIIKLAICKC